MGGKHVQLPPEKAVRAFSPASGLVGANGSPAPEALQQVFDNGDSLRSSGCLRLVSARSLVREMQSQPRTDSKIILPVIRVVGKIRA